MVPEKEEREFRGKKVKTGKKVRDPLTLVASSIEHFSSASFLAQSVTQSISIIHFNSSLINFFTQKSSLTYGSTNFD